LAHADGASVAGAEVGPHVHAGDGLARGNGLLMRRVQRSQLRPDGLVLKGLELVL
jgi:hypothetical protein